MEQQIQHLIERQQQLEAALTLEQAARTALEARATATPRGEESQQRTNIDTRLLGKPDRFDGSDSSWKDWEFVTRSYLMAAIGGIGQGLQTAESEPNMQVQNVHLNPEQRGASTQLYFALVMLTTGRALDKVQGAGAGEGFQAWRELHNYWQPRTATRFVGLLREIITFQIGNGAELLDSLEMWKIL